MKTVVRSALFACVLVLLLPLAVHAQEPVYSGRAYVPQPRVLAMGNAAVALPTAQSVFFYNPAHLSQVRYAYGRSPLVLLGARASFSPNFPDQHAFFRDRLNPALGAGLETLGEAERAALLQDALALGQDRTFGAGTLLLPSFVLNREGYGIGGGLFADGQLHYRVVESEAAPIVDFLSRADFMVVTAGALDLGRYGFEGFSAGLTAKYTQRFLTLKNAPLTALDDDENLYLLGSGALGADVGVHYATPDSPLGRLHAGATLYDALGADFEYKFRSFYVKNSEMDEATLRAEQALAAERVRLQRSYRIGTAYTSPPLGPLEGIRLAVDYMYEPSLAAGPALSDHVRMGLEVQASRSLALRAGLNQGRLTYGAGLRVALARIDYAYHHVQPVGLPGGWNHTVQIGLGSF